MKKKSTSTAAGVKKAYKKACQPDSKKLPALGKPSKKTARTVKGSSKRISS